MWAFLIMKFRVQIQVCSSMCTHMRRSELNSHVNALRLGFIWMRSRTLDAPSTVMNLKTRSTFFRPETECRAESRSLTLLSYSEELLKHRNRDFLIFCELKRCLFACYSPYFTHINTLFSLSGVEIVTTHSSLSAGCRPERISSSQHLHSQSHLSLRWWCREPLCAPEV